MNKIIVAITGTTPLLMHNPSSMRPPQGGKRQIPTPEEEAAAARFLMPGSEELALKDDHIHSCLKQAARGYRLTGREAVGPYIAGSLEIQPLWIGLGKTEYEIDVRRAVVKGAGVMRARPRVWPWGCTFELHYDATVFSLKFIDGTLREDIFLRAGTGIGLCDYRPAKGGKFGRFTLTGWEH